jgi:hypothetical protein
MPSDASHAPFYAILAHAAIPARASTSANQTREVLRKVLCHNMCVLIRATHDLGVEATFGAGSGVEPKLFI